MAPSAGTVRPRFRRIDAFMNHTEHSPLGGSTLKRWSNCPGSVRLCKDIPNPTSIYAEEGTRAHAVAAYFLVHRIWPKDFDDPDMAEAIMIYTDTVLRDLADTDSLIYVETQFSLESILKGMWGTADCVVYLPKQKLLRVYDYKHGSGTLVEIEEDGKPNLQLSYYALGAFLELNLPIDEVEIIIVQPRAPHPDGPVRRSHFPGSYLTQFAASLGEWARATEDVNAPLKAGSHCKFCPAAPICPEIHKKATELACQEFSVHYPLYDPEKLSQILNWLPTISNWVTSVREFAYRESQHGRVPPGWKLVPKRAIRKWRDEKKIIEYLKCDWEDEDIFNQILKSPAQIEKMINPSVKSELTSFIVRESSGQTLVPSTDPRIECKSEFEIVTKGEL